MHTALGAALAAVFLLSLPQAARAQAVDRLEIWDIPLGTQIADIPASEVGLIACGTNGGPPSTPIAPQDFRQCPAESGGLHEIYFGYDDELELVARAGENLEVAVPATGTRVHGFEAIASLLVDDGGLVQGIRIVTDPRAVLLQERNQASDLGDFIMARFRQSSWQCTDHPPLDGYTPVAGIFLDRSCSRTDADAGVAMTVIQHHYRKPGQMAFSPVDGTPQPGYLESTTRFEMVAQPPATQPVAWTWDGSGVPVERDRMLDCPGCDLAGANLKRMDLAGANLAGADLSGANFHGANLQGAILDGANLSGANLNGTRLVGASFEKANLSRAMLFRADFSGANFAGADLSRSRLGESRGVRAVLTGANLTDANLRQARLSEAGLAGADLSLAILFEINLSRSDLTGANLNGSLAASGNFRGATLTGASLQGVDFLAANLRDADLTGTDLRGSRLTRSTMAGALIDGALLEGTLMPSGRLYAGD